MTPEEIREVILNAINPTYERKFGYIPSKNCYNISSLTHGARAFLSNRIKVRERGFNRHLLRGSAIDEYVKSCLESWDSDGKNTLKWTLPFEWTDKVTKDILLLGHFDLFKDGIVLEIKAPESEERFIANGSMLRATRQVSAYAKILSLRLGRKIQAFIVTINNDIIVTELTQDQIETGW